MSIKVVVSAMLGQPSASDYPQEASGGPSELAVSRVRSELDKYPDAPLTHEVTNSDHGIGASWQTVVIELTGVFFGIPAFHKKFKDTVAGWKDIKKDFDKFAAWLKQRERVYFYSKEVVFLDALERLETITDVSELGLYGFTEIVGKSSSREANFDNTATVYYLFLFKDGREALYFMLYDSKRNLITEQALTLDDRNIMPIPQFPQIEK